jgi:predicted nuclease of predicted toxin-antitoxin system
LKVLLDSCVWGPAAEELSQAGHSVAWVGDWSSDPGDEAVLQLAAESRSVLVTLDKDFGELAIVRGQRHAGIVRLAGISAKRQAAACIAALGRYGDLLVKGAIVTVEPGRIRIKAPE